MGWMPLYSRKLHIRVRRDSTSCVTSLITLALSFGLSVVNHFASRCETRAVNNSARELDAGIYDVGLTTLPCRDRRMRYLVPESVEIAFYYWVEEYRKDMLLMELIQETSAMKFTVMEYSK